MLGTVPAAKVEPSDDDPEYLKILDEFGSREYLLRFLREKGWVSTTQDLYNISTEIEKWIVENPEDANEEYERWYAQSILDDIPF